jgi:hypothetical protein
MFKVWNDIPSDIRPHVMKALKQHEKASGQPVVIHTYEEIQDASEWLAAYGDSLTVDQLNTYLIGRFNDTELACIHGLLNAKSDVEVEKIKKKVRSSLQRSRRLIQRTVQMVRETVPVEPVKTEKKTTNKWMEMFR